jgi:hypothetical protein
VLATLDDVHQLYVIVLARRLLMRKAGPLPGVVHLAVRTAVPVGEDCAFVSG